MFKIFLLTFLIFNISADAFPESFFTFNDGKLGVNFGGYKASVDLNRGRLGASAETPFGQKAAAGLGGLTGENEQAGGLFAGAQSGYGQKASAGLGGFRNRFGQAGGLLAGADSGYGNRASAGLGAAQWFSSFFE